jgi:hypothetical protein
MGVKVGDWAFELSLLASWVFLFCVGLKKYLLCCRVPTLSYGVQRVWNGKRGSGSGMEALVF